MLSNGIFSCYSKKGAPYGITTANYGDSLRFLFYQLSARDTKLVGRFEGFPYLGAADFAAQRFGVEVDDLMHLLRRFFEELNTVFGHAQLEKMIQILRARLFDGVVHRVAAAFVHADRVGHADPVLQGSAVLFTRAPAVGVVRTFAEEGTVHAVLRMEHRQMLMDHDLHVGRRADPEQVDHLLDVQVVGRRDHVAADLQEQLGRQVVGDVQREIADQPRMHGRRVLLPVAQVVIQRPGVAYQHRVGLETQDVVVVAVFARHVDARRRQRNLSAGCANGFNGCRELLDKLEVGVDK